MIFELKSGIIAHSQTKKEELPDTVWENLAMRLNQEKTIASISASTLAKRYTRKESMLIVHQQEVISHLSCAVALEKGKIKKEGMEIQCIPQLTNSIPAYLFLTGWTHPHFRCQGLSLFLRQQFFSQKSKNQALLFGISAKTIALSLFQKLGGTAVKPTIFPFVYALSSINTYSKAISKNCQRGNASFWVANLDLAEQLNQQIAEATNMTAAEWANFLNVDPRWNQWDS